MLDTENKIAEAVVDVFCRTVNTLATGMTSQQNAHRHRGDYGRKPCNARCRHLDGRRPSSGQWT